MEADLQKHIGRVVGRSRSFCGATEPGHFLVNVQIPYKYPGRTHPLCDFDLDTQLTDYLEERLNAARPLWALKEGLDDDSIPSFHPRFGIAEHSAWLGMEVRYQSNTCLPVPMLKSPADLDRLELSEETKWFRYMQTGYEYLRSRKDGTFALSIRGSMGPMDLANAVRGDDIFTDFLLEPDFAHRLLAFLVDAIHWYYGHLASWADDVEGGRVFRFGNSWMGPRCLGHLSNDAALLCSPEVYAEFGFPYERQLAERYDGILYHVHNEKMHYVPSVARLPRLRLLEVANDPMTPAPIEDLNRIFATTGSANLMLHATSEQVRRHIDQLKARNVFLNVQCRDRAEAEDMVAFVRRHSEPL
jgi:hypothetical protein